MTDPIPEPRGNPDLFGHEGTERDLLAAWNGGRLPHAWLIGGISGIGKATLAIRFARFVLANGAKSGPPPSSLYISPEHPVFKRVRAGAHADMLTVERRFDEKRGKMKTDIAVDDVRQVSGFFHRTTAEGGWRVVVIDGVEQMNASGHNALLKIIEEPPERALLLLVTEAPGGLLPTIRSRCRKLSLEPLSEVVVNDLLCRHRPDITYADSQALSRLSEGSIGHALNLAGAGGLDLYRQMIKMLATLPRLDLRAAHVFADSLTRKGDDAVWETATALLVWWLARLVRTLARGEVPVEIVAGETALVIRLAANSLDRWLEVWENIVRLFARANSANLDRKHVMLTALLGIEAAAD